MRWGWGLGLEGRGDEGRPLREMCVVDGMKLLGLGLGGCLLDCTLEKGRSRG